MIRVPDELDGIDTVWGFEVCRRIIRRTDRYGFKVSRKEQAWLKRFEKGFAPSLPRSFLYRLISQPSDSSRQTHDEPPSDFFSPWKACSVSVLVTETRKLPHYGKFSIWQGLKSQAK
jgi:hypothetical protein